MRLGRYEVKGEVARGGFGVVLRAYDPALLRDVAIKVLLGGAGAGELQRKRFEREINALARLRHPNIVAVHEAGVAREGPFVVMDFVDGRSLEDRLAQEGPLPLRDALRLMETVGRAIGHAHGQGVLHRDLKPGNVLVDHAGAALVTDFGLAREIDPHLSTTMLSRSGASLGTPGYWPPEQAYGQLERIGPTCDVYGLGATLYALLTGEPPYSAPGIIELMGLMASPPEPPSSLRPEVPPALDAVVLRALAHEPGDRYPSAEAFVTALTDIRRRLAASPAAGPTRGSRILLLGGAGALALTLLGGALVLASRRADAEPPGPVGALPPAPVTATEEAPTVTEAPPSPRPVAPPEPHEPPPDPLAGALAAAQAALDAGRPRAALDLATRVLDARPDLVDALLLRARARALLEDLPGAVQDASVALSLAPARYDAALLRVLLRREQKDARGVIEDAERVLVLTGSAALVEHRAHAYAQRAWGRKELGDVTGALEDYTEAVSLAPTAEWLVEVGNLSLELGHLQAALNDFTSVLLMEPDYLLALLNRTAVHLRLELLDEALADAERAVALRPDLGVTWLRRGEARHARGEDREALADLDRALALEPSVAGAWAARAGTRTALGDLAGAIDDYRQAMLRGQTGPDVRTNLAQALRRAGELQAARDEIEPVLRADPNDKRALSLRAAVRRDLGDHDGALADYGRLIALDPDAWRGHYNRAHLRAQLGDAAGAIPDYDHAIELAPEEYVLWLDRGDLRRHEGDLEGALADLRQAAALEQEDPKIDLALGLALHQAKAYAEADAALTRYLEAAPDHARVVAERGMVREKRVDIAGALADYRHAHELTREVDDGNVHAFTRQRIRALAPLVEGQ